jgi:hypothetical protein
MRTGPLQAAKSQRLAAFYGIWFLCVGAGFCLLGIRSWLEGDLGWRIAIRFLIGAGFVVAAAGYIRQAKRK